MTESSVESEISRESRSSTLPVALSYLLMLVYVTVSLGKWVTGKAFFVKAKFTVGFFGVLMVIFSVTSAFGLFAWIGIKVDVFISSRRERRESDRPPLQVQIVIIEVVPFLTLAIGVDNIFLILHEVEEVKSVRRESLRRAVESGTEAVDDEVGSSCSLGTGDSSVPSRCNW